jgi:hypothetical protein
MFCRPHQMVIELPTSHRMDGSKMLGLICPDGRWVAHLMPKMDGWVMANTPNPGIKMAGLIAHVPAGQFPQSSSEDFCYEPWNSIPGRFARSPDNTHQLARSPDNTQRFARSPDNPQRFARWGDNLHQSMRWGDCPQPFMGWVAHLMPKMGGWVMADTPNPGIKMAGLIAHVPSRGRSQPQSSSEDWGYEPWNSIPGRFARSPDNTQRFARSPDNPQRFARSPNNPHQLVRRGDRPQSFMGWVAPLNSPMGGWVMADTPNPGIKMAGLIAHVPSRGQLPRSPGGSS